jgi:hypothetical protein
MNKLYPYNTGNPLFPFFSKIDNRLFFFLIFILEVLLIFQGLDLSDEGFLSTFYSHIFNNPVSVSYNFMFWLTGVIGGAWAKVFSPFGLLGIRLGGAVVNTVTAILTFQLLKKYLNPVYLKIGLLLVVLSLNNDIKVLNYNILSALFYIVIVIFLFSGLQKKRLVKILLSGFFVGLNVFIRTPNILELGLALGILYYHYLTGWSWAATLKQITVFIAGFLIAIGCVVLAMHIAGHLPIFLSSMKLLFTMGKGVKNPDVEGGYGIFRLLDLFRSNIVESLKYALIPAAFVFGCLYLLTKFRNNPKPLKFLLNAGIWLAIAGFLFLIIVHKIDHFTELFFLNGLILLAAITMISSSIEKEIKMLFFFGVFFLLSFPLGSSDGIFTAGRYCLWIALPVTMNYILNIDSTNFTWVIKREKKEHTGDFLISEKLFAATKKILVFILIFAGFYFVYYYPFFDRRNRMLMRYSLQSDNLKGIYTTKGRAAVFNELLLESTRYMKPNDYVIAYDNMAMFYYATKTVPLLTNPLPGVYSSTLFRADLNSMQERSSKLPPVVMQKIATIGDASKWPEETMAGSYSKMERNLTRNYILDSFLKKNNYKEVWSNQDFKILIPDSVHLSAK